MAANGIEYSHVCLRVCDGFSSFRVLFSNHGLVYPLKKNITLCDYQYRNNTGFWW